jgi:hypothetical protein
MTEQRKHGIHTQWRIIQPKRRMKLYHLQENVWN